MLALVLLTALYVRAHYHLPTQALEVSQADLSDVTDAVLLEKRPLVIVDRVKNHSDLVRLSAFRLLHVKSYIRKSVAKDEVAVARFTLLTQEHSDVAGVEIRHPRSLAGALVLLGRHQTLVLPPRWRYRCREVTTLYELHDSVSLALHFLTGNAARACPRPA